MKKINKFLYRQVVQFFIFLFYLKILLLANFVIVCFAHFKTVILKEKIMHKKIETKNFTHLIGELESLSAEIVAQHLKLYEGYVSSTNELNEKFSDFSQNLANPSFSEYRNFVSSRAFPLNGIVLHEMYFENLTSNFKMPCDEFKAEIQKHFTDFETFVENFKSTAMSARSGWALCCYNCLTEHIENYAIDLHDEHVPLLIKPLLVIDVWEHAYILDYGINKKEYLNRIFKNINWEIVKNRLLHAIAK